MIYSNAQLERFMRESNAIEGEIEFITALSEKRVWDTPAGRLNPADLNCAKEVVRMAQAQKPFTGRKLLSLHGKIGAYLNVDWTGKYRDCNVRVGKYIAPHYRDVPGLMKQYFKDFPELDSWEAHNRFEKIHPFQDLNGRMGRLIWLYKATKESVPLNLPFLHRYYYQTLEHFSHSHDC